VKRKIANFGRMPGNQEVSKRQRGGGNATEVQREGSTGRGGRFREGGSPLSGERLGKEGGTKTSWKLEKKNIHMGNCGDNEESVKGKQEGAGGK